MPSDDQLIGPWPWPMGKGARCAIHKTQKLCCLCYAAMFDIKLYYIWLVYESTLYELLSEALAHLIPNLPSLGWK